MIFQVELLVQTASAFIDDTIRDTRYALRTFRRAPLLAFTIVATVGLGLGLVAAAFTLLSTMLFRADTVPDVDQMYAVARPHAADGSHRLTRAQWGALRRETSIFTDAYGELSDVDSVVDGRLMWGTFVTGNFFDVLRVHAALGRALTPADDEAFAGSGVMVLSHRGWDRLFARDPTVIGRRLLVNGHAFEIVGVMPEGFRGLSLAPDDYWAPLSMLGRVRNLDRTREANVGLDVVGRLQPELSPQTAAAGLGVWEARQASALAPELRGSALGLEPKRGTVRPNLETMGLFAPFFFAFGLILLIGCANVANLLLTRAVARQRDIGIQLSLGATRRRIVRQLLTESLLLALAAAAAGFAVSRVALEAIVHAVTATAAADLGDIRLSVPHADWRVLLFLVVGAGVSTVLFGLAPALHATRIEPVRTIRGEVMGEARPGRARSVLVGLQVSASALLLICAAVFLRSASAAAAFDSGVRTDDTVFVEVANEPAREAIVQAVAAEPSVAAVAANWPHAPLPVWAEASAGKVPVAYKLVSPEFFDVLGIAVVRGRSFTSSERTSGLSVTVVSESAARVLWPSADPVGQEVRLDAPSLASRTFTVAGVVRDVAGLRVAPFERAVVYVPTSTTRAGTSLVARVHGDPERARRALITRLAAVDPEMGRRVITMKTIARAETYLLKIAFALTVALGGLALALTLSGLFSVLSYLVEQRTREIGVRIALGATTRDVTHLVLRQSIRPVGFGLLVGVCSAAGLAVLLLATPAAATIGQVVHVFDPVAYAVSLSIIIAACLAAASIPATRAARLNATQALRSE